MKKKILTNQICSKKILQARHDHYLYVEDLSGLSGLTNEQILSLEQGINRGCFVDDAHAIDCAKRVANSLGLPQTYFLGYGLNLNQSHAKNVDLKQKDIPLSFKKNKIFVTPSSPLKGLEVLADFDFSLPNYKINVDTNKDWKFFLRFLSNSPSVLAPVMIIVIAIVFIWISFV